MRFLLIACLLFLLVRVATLPVAGAAHQVCPQLISDQASAVPADLGTLLINEVVLNSITPWNCPNTTLTPDITDTSWVEIYNPHDQPVNIYASRMTIDGGDSIGASPMTLPFGATIAAHGFSTFFISSSTFFSHTDGPFTLRLLIMGIPVDQITLPLSLGRNLSYARVPDGAPNWQVSDTPTIGISNVLPTPTPTPTPKPTHTPAARHPVKVTSKSPVTHHKSTSTQASTTVSDSNTSDVAISNGVQPVWDRLQLPGRDSSTHISSSPTNVHAVNGKVGAPGVSSDTGDIEHKILITTLVVGVVSVLYACWHRFIRLRARKTIK